MEASQHSLLAACFTLHSINATLAIVPQRRAGLWIRPRRRWVDNIKMDLREIGWDGIDLDQDRDQWRALANTVMNLRVP
jgi:hypothetical protein